MMTNSGLEFMNIDYKPLAVWSHPTYLFSHLLPHPYLLPMSTSSPINIVDGIYSS